MGERMEITLKRCLTCGVISMPYEVSFAHDWECRNDGEDNEECFEQVVFVEKSASTATQEGEDGD